MLCICGNSEATGRLLLMCEEGKIWPYMLQDEETGEWAELDPICDTCEQEANGVYIEGKGKKFMFVFEKLREEE